MPHLLCDRLHPDKILLKVENQSTVFARFNDIATTRAVCLQGLGWTLLPAYSVKDELLANKLVRMDANTYGKSKYGLWWIHHRSYLRENVEKLIEWMSTKEL